MSVAGAELAVASFGTVFLCFIFLWIIDYDGCKKATGVFSTIFGILTLISFVWYVYTVIKYLFA